VRIDCKQSLLFVVQTGLGFDWLWYGVEQTTVVCSQAVLVDRLDRVTNDL